MRISVIIAVSLFLAVSAFAVTWRVEKDGSGDYTKIQDAVNASVSGDSILIGPGRYDDLVPFETPYVSWLACVNVPGIDLTLVGAGRDETIIGPAVPGDMSDDGWRGIVNWPMVGDLVVEDLTIENLVDGVHLFPETFQIRNCRLRGCDGHAGLLFGTSDWALIESCEFADNWNGIRLFPPCANPVIRDCTFSSDTNTGVYSQGMSGVIVQDCSFSDSKVYFEGGSGRVTGCSFWDSYSRLILLSSGNHEIYDNILDGTRHSWCIHLELSTTMIGSGNILRGASQQAIAMLNSQVTFTGNHIFSDGDFVRAYGYYSGLVELDFRNNYWGTSDPEEIAARILDGHDDPAELGYVIF